MVHLFTILEKFSAAFAKSVKKHLEKEARRQRMEKAKEKKDRTRRSRRHSRSPERGGSRRDSRSPVGRRHRRSRSVEGKNADRGSNEGKSGGANLLAAIMAKGGLQGLKADISLKANASPGTKQRHEALHELTATLIQMNHPRDEVKSIAERISRGRYVVLRQRT